MASPSGKAHGRSCIGSRCTLPRPRIANRPICMPIFNCSAALGAPSNRPDGPRRTDCTFQTPPDLAGCPSRSPPAGSTLSRNPSDAFRQVLRPLAATRQPHGDGADDTQPGDARAHAGCLDGHVLRPTCDCRSDHHRGHVAQFQRPGLSTHSGAVRRSTGERLEGHDGCRARTRRQDFRAVHALRPRGACRQPAHWCRGARAGHGGVPWGDEQRHRGPCSLTARRVR